MMETGNHRNQLIFNDEMQCVRESPNQASPHILVNYLKNIRVAHQARFSHLQCAQKFATQSK